MELKPEEYKLYFIKWKKFFKDFNFKEIYSDSNDKEGYHYACFISWHENPLRIDLYCGYYLEETETGGCISIDFEKTFNKISRCPICVDLTENPSSLWEAIILLEKLEFYFLKCPGKIKKDKYGIWFVEN